jgi:sucrose phosphorylase
MPARGLLSERQIQTLVDATLTHGGRVSYKTNADGSQSVYELNISYFDALSDPTAGEPRAVQVARFITSQAIMLSLAGLPGIYVHSLLGSQSWQEGVALTGRNRSINRQKFDRARLEEELAETTSLRRQVFDAYSRLLRARAAEPAFHPQGRQKILFLDNGVFALTRTDLKGNSHVLCLHNVAGETRDLQVPLAEHGLPLGPWRDRITGSRVSARDGSLDLSLPAYAVRWYKNLDT